MEEVVEVDSAEEVVLVAVEASVAPEVAVVALEVAAEASVAPGAAVAALAVDAADSVVSRDVSYNSLTQTLVCK